jgi:2-dehydro-3-deoxyphosphooctonate aldolase (KDO 8-P synthase)
MKINVGNFSIGSGEPLCVIAGPCQIESAEHAMMMAGNLKSICSELGVNFVYKSSFDKANRTSISTKRGVGIDDGLQILFDICPNRQTGVCFMELMSYRYLLS